MWSNRDITYPQIDVSEFRPLIHHAKSLHWVVNLDPTHMRQWWSPDLDAQTTLWWRQQRQQFAQPVLRLPQFQQFETRCENPHLYPQRTHATFGVWWHKHG